MEALSRVCVADTVAEGVELVAARCERWSWEAC